MSRAIIDVVAPTPTTLDQRTLNRTTLARQGLLERRRVDPVEMVEHLVGLQAQEPADPYVALWSRIDGFDPMAVSDAIEDRRLVRIVVMRGTIHLVTAGDCVALRSHMQPVLDHEMTIHQEHKGVLAGLDLTEALAFAEPLLTERALTPAELRAELAPRFGADLAAALAFACRNNLPLIQTPPRGLYQRSGTVRTMTARGWLGRDVEAATAAGARRIVERYLRAFGPASARDVVAWSRVASFGEAMEEMAAPSKGWPGLRRYRNERGVELFDVIDGELVDADVPAPVRFTPEYDNVLLSHRDRSRFGGDDRRKALGAASAYKGGVLVDGLVSGAWHVEREAGARPARTAPATVVIEHLRGVDRRACAELERSGAQIGPLITPEASAHHVRLVKLDG